MDNLLIVLLNLAEFSNLKRNIRWLIGTLNLSIIYDHRILERTDVQIGPYRWLIPGSYSAQSPHKLEDDSNPC